MSHDIVYGRPLKSNHIHRRYLRVNMHFSSLCEIIAAAHLSVYVSGNFQDRGGLMLVAPPGHLKTTAAEILEEFERTLVISDLTVKSLVAMREDILGGMIQTLIFSDYAKIHKRQASVSANIEGIIMSLVGEGFRRPAFSDQRVQALPARCTVVGCITNKFSESMNEMWMDNGFYRRFMWAQYLISNPELIDDAIGQWRKAELDGDFSARIPINRTIQYSLNSKEVDKIRYALRFMPGDKKVPYILAQKILCVLKWKFEKEKNKAMFIWEDFAQSLSKNGAQVEIKEKTPEPSNKKKQK